MNYVYIFKNYYDEVIYIGKTGNIKRRINQHFEEGHLPNECYKNIKEIKYAEVGNSKYDAEIIETILINELKPEYNTEKVFMERSELSKYKTPDLNWKNIYFEVTSLETKVSFNKIDIDVFNFELSDAERVKSIVRYNIEKLKYNEGFYKYYFDKIFEENVDLFLDIRTLYLHTFLKLNIQESDIDECVTENQEDINVYAAFNIKDTDVQLKSINSLLLALKYKFIYKINDELYGIPLHNLENIKIMSRNA